MGLDIYLHKCPDLSYALAMEAAHDAELDKLYGDWNELTKSRTATQVEEDEFNRKRAEAKLKYEIDGFHHVSNKEIYFKSKTDPEHLFKIGYLRSSYNNAGINSVARVFGLPDLYDIFDVDSEEYRVEPDWDMVYTNLNDAIEKWQAHADGPAGKYYIDQFRPTFAEDRGVKSDQDAMERFNQQYLKDKEKIDADDWKSSGWMSREGNFYPKPLKVAGVIAGIWDSKQPISFWNTPSTYLIIEREDSETMQWYVTALLIVKEMVEYVLEQPDKEQYYLSWSG